MAGYYLIAVNPVQLAKVNKRHDKARHIVCMVPWVKYDGRFGYPPDRDPRRPKLNRWLADPLERDQ